MIYLDYAATTPLDGEVLEEMLPYLTEEFGNPDSLHAYGRRAAYAVTRARDEIAALLGVRASEVFFTSGGTEADNWAVKGLSSAQEKKGVCLSAVEHHAVLGGAEGLQSVSWVKPDTSGTVRLDGLKNTLTADTGTVCVMAVNNETGVMMPVEELYALTRERNALLFCDCVQAGCTQDLRALARSADALSLSSHKVYGPKGVGALIVKKGVKISPLIAGGEQEHGLRGGTLNVAGIVGFARALKKAQAEREAFSAHARSLQTQLESTLKAALKERVRVDGEGANRVPNISHLTFYGGGSETLLQRLDLMGIALSNGAACSAHTALPSHVMLAMGASEEEARRGIRVSYGKSTTADEVQSVAEKMIAILEEKND